MINIEITCFKDTGKYYTEYHDIVDGLSLAVMIENSKQLAATKLVRHPENFYFVISIMPHNNTWSFTRLYKPGEIKL